MNAKSNAIKTKLAPSQIRFRVLLVILLLLSPFGAVNLWAVGKVIRAKCAVSKITSLGGQVVLGPDLSVFPTACDIVLGWHRSVFGDTSATSVSFLGLPIHDADLHSLDGLGNVYGLCLDNTPITDAGLDILKTRTEIRFLSLKNTAVTDAGLQKLERMSNLQRLSLDGTKITDAGLAHLKGLNVLSDLSLARTQVTSKAIKRIEVIPHLESIILKDTGVSKDEWDRLQKLLTDRAPTDDNEDW
jgi:hypothetical protein